MKTGLFFVLLSSTAMAARVGAAPHVEASVVIRTYEYAILPSETLVTARIEAEQIFRSAHIAVKWIDCWVPGKTAGAACTEALSSRRDLLLRLVDRRPADLVASERVLALGESMVDREERGGVLMTVDLFPVRTIAERTGGVMAVLLGRAIAHEIGHLLLGTAQHARLGLMRAFWSHDEMRGERPANWGFSAREAAQMRQTLRGRTRTAD
jgi:hypothetical protein